MRNISAVMVALIFSSLWGGVTAHASSTSAPDRTAVTINFVDCAVSRSGLSLNIRNLATRKVVLDISQAPTRAMIRTATVHLAPAPYDVLVSTDICSQHTVFSVLEGMPAETITLIGRQGLVFSGARDSISGALPMDGLFVAIVYKEMRESSGHFASADGYFQVPAIVEGKSYYAGQVPTGNATIRIYDATRLRWLDAATVTIQRDRLNIVRNITSSDIMAGVRGGL